MIRRTLLGVSYAAVLLSVWPFTISKPKHTQPFKTDMLLDENRFVPEAMQKRIDSGTISAFDLNKLYPLTRRDQEILESGLVSRLRGKNRVAAVIGLESCLVDAIPVIAAIYIYCIHSIIMYSSLEGLLPLCVLGPRTILCSSCSGAGTRNTSPDKSHLLRRHDSTTVFFRLRMAARSRK